MSHNIPENRVFFTKIGHKIVILQDVEREIPGSSLTSKKDSWIPKNSVEIVTSKTGDAKNPDLGEMRGAVINHRLGKFVGGVIRNEGPYIKKFTINCQNCGKDFQHNDRRKRYCSKECKDDRDYEVKKEIRSLKKSPTLKKCPFCGEWYLPKSRKSTTCGKGKCRTAIYRQRKRITPSPSSSQ